MFELNLYSGEKSAKNIEPLEQLSHFKTKEEYYDHMVMWLEKLEDDFTESELKGLKWIIVLSENLQGVCVDAEDIILETICKDCLHYSLSTTTLKRMIRLAVELGMLRVYEFVEAEDEGLLSITIYVFNPFISDKHQL